MYKQKSRQRIRLGAHLKVHKPSRGFVIWYSLAAICTTARFTITTNLGKRKRVDFERVRCRRAARGSWLVKQTLGDRLP